MTRLITIDVDGTILPRTTIFEVVLRALGKGDFVEESDRKFFAGQQSLEQTFWEQWEVIQDYELIQLSNALRKAPWWADLAEGVRRLKDAGYRVHCLTDQPSSLVEYLGRFGLTQPICSQVRIEEGRQVEIDASFDKWANLEARLQETDIDPLAVTHIGNGSNDVPVWGAVGTGIAVFADPEVAQHADVDLGAPESFLRVVDWILSND